MGKKSKVLELRYIDLATGKTKTITVKPIEQPKVWKRQRLGEISIIAATGK